MFSVIKTYGHDLGLSACFRQHRAMHSHCSLLHGYALSFQFTFVCNVLDERNWVIDFGALDGLKDWLRDTFDHKLLVALDDPQIDAICSLQGLGLAEVLVLERVGCEAFAQLAHKYADNLAKHMTNGRAWCLSCKVSEHGANSAVYMPGSAPNPTGLSELIEMLNPPITAVKGAG